MTDGRAARRGLLAAVGAAAVGVWLPADRFRDPPSWTPAETGWPVPRGDPARTAAAAAPGPTTGLELAWSARVAARRPVRTLLAAGGDAVTATRESLAVVGADGRLRRRVRSLGPFETPLSVRAVSGVADGPVVRGDTAVYGLGDGGHARWRLAPDTGAGRSLLVGDTLLVENGDDVLAVDTATGGVRWRVAGPTPVAWADDRLVGPGPDGGLVALDTASRRRDWHTRRADGTREGLIAGDRFVAVGERLTAYGLGDGRRRWQSDHEPDAPPATDGHRVFCVVGDRLVAVAVADGQTVWERRVPGLAGTGPAVAGGVVYAQTRRGVVAFDRATGAVVTQFVVRSAPGRAVADPVVAGGRLYLAFDGAVYAVGGGS